MDIPASGPLVFATDERLLRAVTRAAAAANVVPVVQQDPRTVLSDFIAAPMVLIGSDSLAELVEQALPRRGQVYVVCDGAPERGLLADALRCGATAVLELPGDEARLVDLLTDTADGPTARGRLVGVIGGSGGAGATTFAAALGLVMAGRSGSALLVDGDRIGGGVEQVLGLRVADGVRWDALSQACGRLSARSLRETLPTTGGLAAVTWPTDRGAGISVLTMRAVLSAGLRGYPVVVVDLPRSIPWVVEEVLPRCDQVLVVSAVTVPALASCLHLTRSLPARGAAAILRGRNGFDASQVERLLGIPVWHRMPDQRGLDEDISLGVGPLRSRRGPLARAAHRVATRLESVVPG